jgi:hypothetical protein
LTVHGPPLEVQMEKGAVTYRLHGAGGLTFEHRGEALRLPGGETVTRNLAERTDTGSGRPAQPN